MVIYRDDVHPTLRGTALPWVELLSETWGEERAHGHPRSPGPRDRCL